MAFDVYLTFNGNCKEAIEFYSAIFKAEAMECMKYSDAPPNLEDPILPQDVDRILHASIPVFGANMMVSDCPSDMELIVGSNISLVLGTDDKDEITRVFDELKVGGEVIMALEPTFWSEWYGMVTDKFGITWNLSHSN